MAARSAAANASEVELGGAAAGDAVLWMQEHLASAIPSQETTGRFTPATARNLVAFQTAHGIRATGRTGPATWDALLSLPPVAVDWTGAAPHS